MGNNVVCRFEPLDDLEAAWLLHEHTLARIVRVADSDHKAIRHLPNALALVECDRHKLPTRRIRAFADEIQPSLFNTLESPFIHLPAEDLGQRCLALELPFLIGFHNSSPPPCMLEKASGESSLHVNPVAWANMAEIVDAASRVRRALTGNKGPHGFPARGASDRRVSISPRKAATSLGSP
jgi:hypothetical protein